MPALWPQNQLTREYLVMSANLTSLIHAAAQLIAETVDALPAEAVATLDAAIAGGAWPAMEVMPQPGRTRVRLLLIEQEGARRELAVIPVREVRRCGH